MQALQQLLEGVAASRCSGPPPLLLPCVCFVFARALALAVARIPRICRIRTVFRRIVVSRGVGSLEGACECRQLARALQSPGLAQCLSLRHLGAGGGESGVR